MHARVRQCQVPFVDDARSVQQQVEIQGTGRIAYRTPASVAILDDMQRIEQLMRR